MINLVKPMENQYDEKAKKVKRVRYSISIILGGAGLIILTTQIIPLVGSYAKGYIIEQKNTSLHQPIPEEQKQQIIESSYFDPGKSYFQNFLERSGLTMQEGLTFYDVSTKSMRSVHIDEEYSEPMRISVPSVGIDSLHITPNVNSYDEAIYNASLKHGAGHFKGTPLPGDGGNSFIYGHSTVESFFSSNRNNPEVAFTKLEKMQFGDNVEIEKDGKKFSYRVKQIKKVPADDFSVLDSTNKETVTLMTCWPLGVGSERLIVIADRYE